MIILLNAPPRAGKDTMAEIMCRLVPSMKQYKMSATMKAALPDLLGVPAEIQKRLEKYKDDETAYLFGKTWREVQISAAEDWLKPTFGHDFFGKLAVRKMKEWIGKSHAVISDCGFHEEVRPIIDTFKKSTEGGVRMIKITRDDCDFDDDSRDWLDEKQLGIQCETINNRFDLDMYEEQIKRWLKSVNLI